jgi:Putative Ig domain
LILVAILTGTTVAGCTVGSAVNRNPAITSVLPSSAVAGSLSTPITVSGVNFRTNETIFVNGVPRPTNYLNQGQIASILTTADLASPRVLQISVARGKVAELTYQKPLQLHGIGVDGFFPFEVLPVPLQIITSSVPPAVEDLPYSAQLEARGGIAPFTWTVLSGQLPMGLSLGPSTGTISGTPELVGEFPVTVEVADQNSNAVLSLRIRSGLPSEIPPSAPDPPPTAPGSSKTPELPRSYVDTSMPNQSGSVIHVGTSADFQQALDGANCGDTIELAEGSTFVGNFVLPTKSCQGWVVVRSSAPDSSLPAAGKRITPLDAHALAKIVSPNPAPAISAQPGASRYRLLGLEITTSFSSLKSEQYGLLDLGEDPITGRSAASVSDLPHDITIDRCYIHGTPTGNVKRGVTLNGASLAVIDSYISDIHVVGQDSQAIEGWNGPGPFKIVDNELEASGENVLFGGARPTLVNNIPSDIEIRGNHFFKPLVWMASSPSYAGYHWAVKNLLEFKIAQRVLVTGNILENNWVDAQNGFAFLITPRTESGTAPWVTVQDITFTDNILRHSANGINISGTDDGDPEKLVRGRRVLIHNNLFTDINGKTWGGGSGRLFQVLSGADAVTIDHNTGFQSGSIISADGIPSTNFVFQNNIAPHNVYGVMGSGYAPGMATLEHYFPGYIFQANVIEDIASSVVAPSNYPATTLFPANWGDVEFVDFANGNYSLAPSSPYKNAATDGKDIGADIDEINGVTSTVIVH